MMNKVNEHDIREMLQKMGDTFAIKNEKYGNSFEASIDKYGMITALTRIGDKFNRIENLILTGDNGTDDEAITDTLIDMANYCVMTAVYMKNSGGRKAMVRITKDDYYLDIALAVSKRSTCLKRHYGCVIVKDDIIIATGYNGSPRGEENCCDRGTCKRANAERYTGYEGCDSVHAEQNALIATSRERLIGATVYLACEEYGLDEVKSALWDEEIIDFHEDKNPVPCGICARMLKNAGVARVVNRSGDICL